MADRRLTLIARRDDGAMLITVAGSACALTVVPGEDGGIWANDVDAIAARPGWQDASGDIPVEVAEAVTAFTGTAGWCDLSE